MLHWTPSASGDVYSPMIRIEGTEDAFISCSIGFDSPSRKLHTSRSGRSVAPHLQHNKQVNCKLSTISRSLAVAAERVACIRSRSARSLTRAWHASERDQPHRVARKASRMETRGDSVPSRCVGKKAEKRGKISGYGAQLRNSPPEGGELPPRSPPTQRLPHSRR